MACAADHGKSSRIFHEQASPAGYYVRSENNEEMTPDSRVQKNDVDERFRGTSTIQIRISDAYKFKSSPADSKVDLFNNNTFLPSETPMPANVYETSFEERFVHITSSIWFRPVDFILRFSPDRILEAKQLSQEAEVENPENSDPQSKKTKLQGLCGEEKTECLLVIESDDKCVLVFSCSPVSCGPKTTSCRAGYQT